MFFDTYDMVVSRCFGWSLPGTMMIPYADLANHHNSDTQYELFNPKMHFKEVSSEESGIEKLKLYQTKCKMMIDYSDYDIEAVKYKKDDFFRCDAYASMKKYKIEQ